MNEEKLYALFYKHGLHGEEFSGHAAGKDETEAFRNYRVERFSMPNNFDNPTHMPENYRFELINLKGFKITVESLERKF